MSGQASTLSACAHVHTTRRLNGACLEGALHIRRRQRWDALPSSAGGVRDMVRPTARN